MNVDFADVRTHAKQRSGLMGEGFGTGRRGLVDAIQQAINSPLLDEVSISGQNQSSSTLLHLRTSR